LAGPGLARRLLISHPYSMIVRRPRLTTTEQIGNLRDGRASPRGRTPRTGKPWGRRKSREGSGSRAGAKEPM